MILPTPSITEIKDFYPISDSMPTHKINEFANYVRNHVFVKMFGFEASSLILNGDIENSESATFIGFKKYYALCVAYQAVKDPFISTNFGVKTVNRSGVSDPTMNQKSPILIDIENTISIHYKEALKVLNINNCKNIPSWSGYFSYKISRV